MKKILLSILSVLTVFSMSQAQDKCAQPEALDRLFVKFPGSEEGVKNAIKDYQNEVYNMSEAEKSTLPDTVIIPIVFHVIHDYGSENVSDETLI